MAARDTSDALDRVVLSLPPRLSSRLKVGAVLLLALVAVAIAVVIAAVGSHGSTVDLESVRPTAGAGEDDAVASPDAGLQASIYVHLLGAVLHPGLYELPQGARAIDVLAAAGGYTETADRASLNLARFLSDGEQVYVPAEGEVPAGAVSGSAGSSSSGKVNLNTADAAALETLPRVGPAMAAKILAWREANGRFQSIDDLRNVSGIGEKTFAALSELVTV